MKLQNRLLFKISIVAMSFATFTACNKTEDIQGVGELEDAVGNVYKTVKIGTQVWTVENLKTTKYNDGTPIPNVTDDEEWGNLKTGAYCDYENLESNAAIYGRMYNFYTIETGKLAPKGWHVPTDDDWIKLEEYIIDKSYNYDGAKDENTIAKSLCAATGWKLSSKPGTPGFNPENNNSTGFSALPGGERNCYGYFSDVGNLGLWWSSTSLENSDYFAWGRCLYYISDYLYRDYQYLKVSGFSVRLVRNN